MRTSARWINDYLEPSATPQEQADTLTDLGLPLDGREELPDGDVAQEIETTSNRGDCLCHFGLAREIAARTGRKLRFPAAFDGVTSSGALNPIASGDGGFCVDNREVSLCPIYTARIIRGVRVGPSPPWLQERLRACGQLPRNNLVDATNFVLLELGQPTHVFDLAKLKGGRIIVRRAIPNEAFTPIGEGAASVKLRESDLVIADGERAVAIAGVKGGAATAVSESTVDILIEAASFSPVAVRATSRALRIASESSYRFERGVNPATVDSAAERLCRLILELAGGQVCGAPIRAGAPVAPQGAVGMRLSRCRRLLGWEVPQSEASAALAALGFSPQASGDEIRCQIPGHRLDVSREVDLIEEVARLLGLGRVPIAQRLSIRVAPAQRSVEALREARQSLVASGFAECVAHSLISAASAAPWLAAGERALALEDERAGAEGTLRPSLLPSLLGFARANIDRGATEIRLFESAAAFRLKGNDHEETERVAGVVVGVGEAAAAYRQARGAVELLVRRLCGAQAVVEVAPTRAAGLDSAGAIVAAGRHLGVVGIVAASAAAVAGLEGPVAAFELLTAPLIQDYPPVPLAQQPPAFPAIDRDLTAILTEGVPWRAIHAATLGCNLPHLEAVEFVTVWRGATLAGRKAVTMRLRFRENSRTLRREEIDPLIATLCTHLATAVEAQFRS